jgi:hypothetical protein
MRLGGWAPYGMLHGRGARWLLLVLLTSLSSSLAAPASAQVDEATRQQAQRRLEGLLASEPPAGFVANADLSGPVEIDADIAAAHSRVFESTAEPVTFLELTLWDPGPGSGSVDFLWAWLTAPTETEEPFDASALHPDARGLRERFDVGGEAWEAYGIYVRNGGLVIRANHEAPVMAVPLPTIRARLGELVSAQLRRPTIAEPTDEVPPEADHLRSLSLQDPGVAPGGHALHHLPRSSGPLTPHLLAELGVDADQRGIWGDLGGGARGYLQHWGDPIGGTDLRLLLIDHGSPRRAGSALGHARSGLASRSGFETFAREGAVAAVSSEPVDGVWLAMLFARRGHLGVVVGVSSVQSDEALLELAARTLDEQLRLLPPGDEEATDPIAAVEVHGEALGAALAVLGMLALYRVVGGRFLRRTRRLALPDVLPERAITVAPQARRLRRGGAATGLALFLAAAVALAGLVPYTWPAGGAWSGAVGLVAIPVIVAYRRRRERPSRPRRRGVVRLRMVRAGMIAVVGVAAVFGAMFVVAVYIMASVGGVSPELRETGTTTEVLQLIALTVGPGLLLVAALTLRVSRREARLRAGELRRLDRRRPVLYLRGFADDILRVPAIVSGRRPTIEFFWPALRDLFENVVTWELDAAGPPVAIAPPGTKLASLGAAREHAPAEQDWLAYVEEEIGKAAIVVVSIGRTEGLLLELSAIRACAAERRTVLLFPPVADDELRHRWAVARDRLLLAEGAVDLPLSPALVLAAVLDDDGRIVAITADQRDEAGYRAAVRAALERVGARASPETLARS